MNRHPWVMCQLPELGIKRLPQCVAGMTPGPAQVQANAANGSNSAGRERSNTGGYEFMAFAPLLDYHFWHMLLMFTLPLTIESTKNRGLNIPLNSSEDGRMISLHPVFLHHPRLRS